MSKTAWHPFGEIPPLTKVEREYNGKHIEYWKSAPLLFLLDFGDMRIATGHFERTDSGDDWVDDCGASCTCCLAYWAFLPEENT